MADGIEIKGIEPLVKKLGVLEGIKILKPPMQRSVLRVEGRMKKYPPAPKNSRYIRGYGFKGGPRTSENLGRRWTNKVDEVSGGITGRIGNTASYAPRVQNKKFQQRIFKLIGWITDQDALDQESSAIIQDFEKTIQDALT